MKKNLIYGAVVVCIILLLAIPKLGWFSSKNDGGEAKGGPAGPPLLPVEAIVVRPEKLDNKLIVTGSVLANESLELKSEISGKITKIAFKEGSHVSKGN